MNQVQEKQHDRAMVNKAVDHEQKLDQIEADEKHVRRNEAMSL